jgi:hypothetical protein
MKEFHTHRMSPVKNGSQFCLKCHREFSEKDYGDKFTLKEFIEAMKNGSFIPSDGSIGEVYVNDKLTNIDVKGWGFWFHQAIGGPPFVSMTFEELAEIKGEVTLMWYNK